MDSIFKCLIACLETELDGKIRKGLADTVGKWMEEWTSRGSKYIHSVTRSNRLLNSSSSRLLDYCRIHGLPGDVPALLPVLLRLATSTSPLHRLSVYQLVIHYPSILFTLSFSTSTSQEAIPLKSGDVAQLLSKGMEDDFVDVRLAAVRAVQGVLEGEHIEDDGRDEVGSDLIGKACHVRIDRAMPSIMGRADPSPFHSFLPSFLSGTHRSSPPSTPKSFRSPRPR